MRKYHISKENAREMQAKGAAVRRSPEHKARREEEKARRAAIAETVKNELAKPIREGEDMSKLEYIVKKVLQDLIKAEVSSVKDLQRLQIITGEAVTKMEVNTRPPSEAFIAMMEDAEI